MGRMEILTGRERRRFWSDAQKLAILEEAAEGHCSVSEVARRHDIIPQQIYAWRRKFVRDAEVEAAPDTATFLPVTVVPNEVLGGVPNGDPERSSASERKGPWRRAAQVEVRCKGGRVLKVEAALEPSLLQALIRVIEAA